MKFQGIYRFFNSSVGDADVKITVHWKLKTGEIQTSHVKVGTSILSAARANNIDVEGACDGVCACSTCHVILEPTVYDSLEEASEEEEDMLDQAFGLTATSRLGCQVHFQEGHNNMTIELPKATRNFYVDGHKPKHH